MKRVSKEDFEAWRHANCQSVIPGYLESYTGCGVEIVLSKYFMKKLGIELKPASSIDGFGSFYISNNFFNWLGIDPGLLTDEEVPWIHLIGLMEIFCTYHSGTVWED